MSITTTIVDFYLGKIPNNAGHRIEYILTRNMVWLELDHTYIQWLFPTDMFSRYNPEAPLLDSIVITAFQNSPELRKRLLASFIVMMRFYGFRQKGNFLWLNKTFRERSQVWLTPYNHNYARLTRIMWSMRLLGFKRLSHELYECLHAIYLDHKDVISQETMAYWEETQYGL